MQTTPEVPLTIEIIEKTGRIKPHPQCPKVRLIAPPIMVRMLGYPTGPIHWADMLDIDDMYPGTIHFETGFWFDPKHFTLVEEV